ncbi:UBP1-associated protein 2C [Cryptomeria japonica]|uniref:UBP1-associated protein 2C n=1 Tax=Cryptomeria japonica TaxID=3369 RepID=UPI0027DA10BA|nr:UBP1-associated protein 2C [Cryptomeria japonica]XP_057841530.2 UBP1-associated protein 2C [Cryptomeria japonica]XP_057841531.2 UBP1-associated protein 2C [Cryptomeria japonica]XP_057841533.2 UBP1-associated protein 2C [Cryptomeria japonica]
MDGKKRSRQESEDSDAPEIREEDVVKLMEPLTREQLFEIAKHAAVRHPDVLEETRKIADRDVSRRKIFVRGLGLDTTAEVVRSVFSEHGELEDLNVVVDRASGKNKGYGFVTYAHVDGALEALKEPSKKIDGRMTVSNLAAIGNPQQQQLQQQQQQIQQLQQLQQFQQFQPVLPIQPVVPIQTMQQPIQSMQHPIQSMQQSIQSLQQPIQPLQQPIQPIQQSIQPMQQPIQPIQQHMQTVQSIPSDVALRRIYIGNVPTDMEPAKLLNFFSQYGDIEEGPLGYDKTTGKCKGYALIVYKTVEASRKAAEDPVKSIDGNQLFCKLSTDGQKQKGATTISGQTLSNSHSTGNLKLASLDSSVPYNGFGHGLVNPASVAHQAAVADSSALAAAAVSSYGLNDAAFPSLSRDLVAASLPYHSLNTSMQPSLGRELLLQGLSARAPLGTGGYGANTYGSSGYNSIGGASSLYGIPSSSSVAQNASYEGASQYALALASYQNQHPGASPPLRVPPGGTLPGMRSYYPS